MQTHWIFWSILSLIFTSFQNIFQLITEATIIDIQLTLLFVRMTLILAGLISAVSFLIPGLQINKELINKAKKEINPYILFGSAISLGLGTIFKIFAFISGSSIALIIIHFNLIISILFGFLFLNENINWKSWLAILLYICVGSFIIYEKKNQ